MMDSTPRPLATLVRGCPTVPAVDSSADVPIRGVRTDSREVQPGHLFIAVPGARTDGSAYAAEAVARGAAAVVAERAVPQLPVPVIRVADARVAASELAAAWYGRPAQRLRLVGITGSLGKTSVLTLLESILTHAGMAAGVIGSLGIRFGAYAEATRMTTPDPVTLQRALSRMAGGGAALVAMEVTSHALDQRRVHGLTFELGVFTNVVLLEHLDYHGSFRAYVRAKERFFDRLASGAPLVHSASDRVVKALVRGRDVRPVGCGASGCVTVRTERRVLGPTGTELRVAVRRPLPGRDGTVYPMSFPLRLRLLGRTNVQNATLAAAAALCLGAGVEPIQQALAALPPPRRRLEVVHRGRITVLDDTVGHPDSISAAFETAARLRWRRLHILYGVRGRRGPEINRRDAEAIAIWARRVRPATLVVTRSRDVADEANRVERAEELAVLRELRRRGLRHEHRPDLEAAVRVVLDRARKGDLVLLLGAQGMDRAAELVRQHLETGSDGAS